jgi:hypothetical protein
MENDMLILRVQLSCLETIRMSLIKILSVNAFLDISKACNVVIASLFLVNGDVHVIEIDHQVHLIYKF